MAEKHGYQKNDQTFSTRAIHVGNEPEQWRHLAVVPPISMSTTFKQDGPAEFRVSRHADLSCRFRTRTLFMLVEGGKEEWKGPCTFVVVKETTKFRCI